MKVDVNRQEGIQVLAKSSNRSADLLVAALLFTTLLVLGGIWIDSSVDNRNQNDLHRTGNIATVQASVFQLNLMRSLSGAKILGAVVESDDGGTDDFEHHANIIISSLGGITNLQLAPDGIVQAIFPLQGHERALGHNLLKDDARRKEADLAIKSRQITVAGPFNLVQGGRAIVARNPIFLDAGSPNLVIDNSGDLQHARQGDEQFWGYSSALIYFDTVMAMTDLPNLAAQGFYFRLWRQHPDTGAVDHLAGDDSLPIERVVSRSIELPNATWNLDVAAKLPAVTSSELWGQWLVNIVLALLLSAWCYNLLRRPKELAQQVTERTADLEKAQAQLRLAATAFESHEAITITDVQGHILEVNRAFTRITGYTPDEVIGKTNSMLHSGVHEQQFYQVMWQQICQGGHWDGEIWNRRKDGELYPAWLSITAVKGPDGAISHYVGHSIDISKRIKAEEELGIAKDKAETANRAKADFLAMMSHEIRTPLNGVLGLLALLRDSGLDAKQQQYVKTARESGEVLLTVINDVLDFSKMEAGKLALEQSTIEPMALTNSVYELMRPKAEAKGVALDVCIEEGIPAAFLGDPGRIRQVLLNLVSNAIKFTHQGRVAIKLAATETSAQGVRLRCEVCDTGIGISVADQHGLFEQFKTVDASYSRSYGGTGLGLSISKQLLELMGGDIGMTSQPGEGSTFWFEIEVTECVAESVPALSPLTTASPASMVRILLVEDVVANRMVARGMLERAGHRVEEATNGFEALQWLQQSRFDLVLMDISMPDMDGLQATAAIRKQPGARGQIPIIAMTAHAMKGDRERFLAAGMDDYLTKPLNLELMLEKVARWSSERPANPPVNETLATVAVEEPAAEEFVDRAILQQLAQDTSPELIPELVSVFVGDARERLQRITAALDEQAVDNQRMESHALGSSAASFGLPRLHQQARRAEQACIDGSVEESLAAGRQLLAMAPEALAQLEQFARDWPLQPVTN